MSEKPLRFDPIAEARRQWVARGWEHAADGMAGITSVMRVQQIAMARVHAVLKNYDLTFARYEALVLLLFSRGGAMPLNRAGARLQVHPTSVTSTVDKLERQGLVKRVAHPTDRRITLVEITPEGRERAEAATLALNDQVFSDPRLTPDESECLFQLLRKLRLEAADFVEPPEAIPPSQHETSAGDR